MIQFTLIGNADMNNLVHSSFYTCLSISVGYIPLIRIAGSKVITCICNLDRYCKTALLKKQSFSYNADGRINCCVP